MPFDFNEQNHEKEERQRQKQLARMQRSELAEVVRAQYTDAPEEDDIRGGAMLGKQREVSKRLAQREAEVTEFEETHMIRLTMGKQEKKERKRIMREEMSNLGAIADLGNVVAGVDDAFGDGTRGRGRRQDAGGNEKFVTKGMRKRKVEVFEPQTSRKGKPRSQNSFQKGLYGGKRSGGNSRRKK
jgi:U3 small nucleolar ribonucleoprotein protein LCP5